MSVSIVSAFEFDNIKRYNVETRELRIVNAFGLGADIVRAKLETPNEVLVLPGWQKVAEITSDKYEDYKTLIESMDFYDRNNKGKKITKEYRFNYTEDKGIVKIELYSRVDEGDKIEWIPTIKGFIINEWAVFLGAVKYDYLETGDNSENGVGAAVYAQTFKASSSYELVGISVYGRRVNAPTVSPFHICSVNSSGQPNCTVILSQNTTTDVSGWSDVNAWHNITMPAYNIVKDINYSLVFNRTFTDNVGEVRWRQNTTDDNLYPNGTGRWYSVNNGTSFGSDLGLQDFLFQIWGKAFSITVNLDTPTNNTQFITETYNFTSNYTVSPGAILTNASYNFWWQTNGTRYNQTNISIDSSKNATEINLTGIDLGIFTWNVYVCANNSGTTECNFADSNRTFERKIFSITARNHSMTTTEGNSETFKFNITLAGGFTFSEGYLVYNNTEYLGSFTSSGQNYYLTRTITAPLTNADVNKTFYWNIIADTGDESNSTNYRQQVNALALDNCSSYTSVVLNYTMKDEGNQTEINGTGENSTMEIDVDIFPKGTSTTTIMNFSQSFNKDNPVGVCISNLLNGSEYRMDVTTLYKSNSREIEYHHIQNYSLRNDTIPQNITLFDLLSADSTAFEITYKDENFLPISNALLDIQRYYVSDGLYKSIEIPKTNIDGKTVAHLVLNDVVYTIIVKKDGVTLATFENVRAFCEDTVTGDCKISLNEVEKDSDLGTWTSYKNLDYTITFDENTRTITLIFSTVDGSTATISLNTTKYDRWGNDTVCSDKLASSSGTLTCLIPASYGNVTVISKIYSSQGSVIGTRIFKIFPDREDYFGGNAVIMMLILILTIPLMFISDTRGVIFGAFLGLLMCGGLMIYTGFQLIGTASAIMWLIIAGGILIWKISERAKM